MTTVKQNKRQQQQKNFKNVELFLARFCPDLLFLYWNVTDRQTQTVCHYLYLSKTKKTFTVLGISKQVVTKDSQRNLKSNNLGSGGKNQTERFCFWEIAVRGATLRDLWGKVEKLGKERCPVVPSLSLSKLNWAAEVIWLKNKSIVTALPITSVVMKLVVILWAEK